VAQKYKISMKGINAIIEDSNRGDPIVTEKAVWFKK